MIKINEYDNIMRALKLKMVTPPFSTKYIYEWSLFFWGFYKSEMAKQNILMQAGTAMLAQANSVPKMALSLLQNG